jgi:hypothetical protein
MVTIDFRMNRRYVFEMKKQDEYHSLIQKTHPIMHFDLTSF